MIALDKYINDALSRERPGVYLFHFVFLYSNCPWESRITRDKLRSLK